MKNVYATSFLARTFCFAIFIAVAMILVTPEMAWSQMPNAPLLAAQSGTGSQMQTVSLTDANGNAVKLEIPATNEATLRKYSPGQMAVRLSKEISNVSSASRAAWSHSARSLPAESGIFTISMGAVVAMQVLLDGSQNPLALHEFLQSHTTPMGTVSFYAFMYSQGVTSNVLSLYLEHPALRSLIPYLGMTVGAFVQSNLAQFAADTDVQMCARSWLPEKSSLKLVVKGPADPCEQAYEKFVNRRKIWEAAPGIASMLLSSAIASGAQGLLRLAGFDLMMWMMPGGVQVKGMRMLLVKGLQISAFVAIDSWLHGKVNYVWKNGVDGREFIALEARLAQEIALQKTLRWNADNQSLVAQLKNYHQRSSEWRMFNLTDVHEAHHAWSQSLNSLTGMYSASYNFYSSFINEVRSAAENSKAPLNRTAPLNGVTAKGLSKEDADLYFTDPLFVETLQMATVQDVAKDILQKMPAYQEQGLTETSRLALKKLAEQLKSGDKTKIGVALAGLQAQVFRDSGTSLSDGELLVELQKIYVQLGKPAPALKPGYGFTSTYESAPATGATFKDVPFYRRLGAFKTETMTDYLLASMICGPDIEAGQQAIFTTRGFPGVFTPPQIRQSGIDVASVCQVSGAPGEGFAPFRLVIPSTQSSDAISFLKKYTRASVLGAQSDSLFLGWWEKHAQPQMQKTIEIYGQAYVKIVAKLISGFFREDISVLNPSEMPNGTAKALLREARLYEKILSDMLSDLSPALRPPIHAEFDRKLIELMDQLKRIQVSRDEKGNAVLKTNLTSTEIEKKKSEVRAILARWAQGFGLGDPTEKPWVKIDSVQKELVMVCLENLNSIAMEAGLYTGIASAVTWEKVNAADEISSQERAFQERKQEQLRRMNKSLLPGQF